MAYTELLILLNKLKNNEKVLCEECKKGYIVPYGYNENNIPVNLNDTVNDFVCTNCDWYGHICPNVIIE